MKFRTALVCGTAVAFLAASDANAATINLVDLGGVTGSASEADFKIAAAYWGKMFTNDVTINLGVRYAALGTGIIGSTGSTRQDYLVSDWEAGVNASKSNSTLDQTVVLPTLKNGGISAILNGVAANGTTTTAVDKQKYSAGEDYSEYVSYMNTSLIKAIGGQVADPTALDGSVTFSTAFTFDFDAGDGITAGQMDFLGVAIHEIGHALGFVSGVDYEDIYGLPKGPGKNLYDINDTSIYSALDMFRYSTDANNLAPGSNPVLDLTVGTASYFSIDGGTTALFGNSFSTGAYNGDGRQASHWKDASGANRCGPQLGIMDPTFCYGQTGVVTGLDLAIYDAMGWNLSVDALANNGGYQASTWRIYRQALGLAVPEPSSWAMMLGGFGLVGGALRRRQRTVISFG